MDDMIKSLSGRRWHLAHPHSTVACQIIVYIITFVILLRHAARVAHYCALVLRREKRVIFKPRLTFLSGCRKRPTFFFASPIIER